MSSYHWTPPATGAANLEQAAAQLASGIAAPALGGLLDSPAVRDALRRAINETLADPQTRGAVRSYLLEASAWLGGAVLLAILLARRL